MKEHEKKAEAKKGKALKEKASEGKTSEGKTSKRKQGQALASQQNIEQAEKTSWHHEDLAMKTAAQYFGEELLPLLGIRGEVENIAPVSYTHLREAIFISTISFQCIPSYCSGHPVKW